MSDLKGIVNIIKPAGATSFYMVKWVKRILDCKKAGHTGTLDPLAAGLLTVCLGRATKIIPFLPETKKEYIGQLTLGVTTDTLDREGQIIEENEPGTISSREIEQCFTDFTGTIEQIPPMYSAVKQGGTRLYIMARQGKTVKRKKRIVRINQLELLNFNLPWIQFRVQCSPGTYIRSLVRDIGQKLGCGAFLSFLVRTVSGPFLLQKAYTLQEIENFSRKKKYDFLIPADEPLVMPRLYLKETAHKKAINGAFLVKEDFRDFKNLQVGTKAAVYDHNRNFISINRIELTKEDEIICRPLRVFVRK